MPMIRTTAIMCVLLALAASGRAQDYDPDYLATFSIIVRDPATGELGFAVQSKAFAAGNREWLSRRDGVIAHRRRRTRVSARSALDLNPPPD